MSPDARGPALATPALHKIHARNDEISTEDTKPPRPSEVAADRWAALVLARLVVAR